MWKSVTLLKRHLRDLHGEKQKCPHCDLLTVRLKDHIYQVHEKKPCPDCGKLFTDVRMKMHIMSVHTPDDQNNNNNNKFLLFPFRHGIIQ